jgi:hypothetical protein
MSDEVPPLEESFHACRKEAISHNTNRTIEYIWSEFYTDLNDVARHPNNSGHRGWLVGDIESLQDRGELPPDLNKKEFIASMLLLKELKNE